MVWYYSQHSGTLSHNDIDVGKGYSGNGKGLDNPAEQTDHDVGPIPQGQWKIGIAFDHPHLGPTVMHLSPETDTKTFGRSGFFIHGDNTKTNHTASHGCVILSKSLRQLIARSKDKELLVQA